MPLRLFHPALRQWFEDNLGRPTDVQAQAWPSIQKGNHTLIAAPTGSGKTLAAFYAVINQLVERDLKKELPQGTQVVYVSPLKALSNDIHRNLEIPLAGLRSELADLKISVAVRTGDTPSSERQKMMKTPPHILVTTPESLYLLLTSQSGRKMLRSVRTLIVDEIHALVGDKRGSHLALSVERLAALTEQPLQRIGLSATQKPIELVAKFLAGENAPCPIIDTGHRRKLDLRLEVPKSPLTAVMSNEVWSELYERLVELIREHKTTLIFVNTRRLAERLARALAERIGEEHVSSHHGSMSKEHRYKAERRLKAGELKVLVATASMELGIDIGSVELVVQFSSPKRIASFLQRVGRSGHTVGGKPKGIMIPLTRDELVEGAALLDSVRRGELDRILMPEEPLDILSQQIVAEVASEEKTVDGLYQIFKRAYPYRNLTQEKFLGLIKMLSEGYTSRRSRRGAYLHYDAIHGRLRARRGARLVALTNGGAIPDMFDYEVVLQPEGITVGTLNEDFALESLAGDIFTLGTHSWQLIRIEGLKVMVHDAAGKPPTVPFWLGESSARSDELSESVSRLREKISRLLDSEPLTLTLSPEGRGERNTLAPLAGRGQGEGNAAIKWLTDEVGISQPAAEQLVEYLWMGKVGIGVMPTQEKIVMERFFDETGDTHLVIHAPFGSRVNRGWGLALRKKFCRKFNFELQAAADENTIILSLSSSHSFPLEEVLHYLNSKTVCDVLIQAMLDAPLFEIRWRWNATRSLAVLRNRAGKRVPPQFQRMQAEDLIGQVFPDQIACAENVGAEREIPEHPLVEQVVRDCLNEAMDVTKLEEILRKIEQKKIEIIAKDLREPSVFAQEIINARPYAFLDDNTEFAERRSNAVRNRGWLDPSEARDLSKLDQVSIDRVREEAWPEVRDADELHDALMIHGFILESEAQPLTLSPEGRGKNESLASLAGRGQGEGPWQWKDFFKDLVHNGRAKQVEKMWIAMERAPWFDALYKEGQDRDEALREVVRGRLEALGPVTVAKMAADFELPEHEIQQTLLALENEGFVFRGFFSPNLGVEEWCERRLLQRIHRYTIEALRESIQPVSIQDYMRFLLSYHHVDEEEFSGPESLQRILAQLEGYEAPAAVWETDLIPSRLTEYDPVWLDVLCMSGKIIWRRFSAPAADSIRGPVKSTPICLVARGNGELWRNLSPSPQSTPSAKGKKIIEYLRSHGASFFEDIAKGTELLPSETNEAIGELVNAGLLTSDSYSGLRALLTPRANRRNKKPLLGIEHAGRWSLVAQSESSAEKIECETLEHVLAIYLKRWGILFRGILEKESFAPPWRILVRVLRRMELRGEIRGGRFVSQVSGEQFALPEVVDALRKIRNQPKTGKLVSISAADPLNLMGFLLPGKRISKITSNRILFRDGIPVAVREGKEVKFLQDFSKAEQWPLQKALVRGKFPAKLRYYLGNYG